MKINKKLIKAYLWVGLLFSFSAVFGQEEEVGLGVQEITVIMKTLKVSSIEFVKVTDLRFNTKARIETDFQSVLERVKENGMSKPLLVERITNKVLSGNLLLLIALELGITHVPVVYTDLKSKENQVLLSVA